MRILVIASVCAGLAACGSSGSSKSTAGQSTATKTSTQATTPVKAKKSKQRKARAARPIGPRVGTSEQIQAQGTKLSITVTKVLDPLKGSGAALLPGTRVVGVFVRIANRGPGGYDSSSTGDISVIPSSGVASPAYAPQGRCKTPLQDFDNAIGPGESREGCVAFTLNTAAKLVAERFSADGGGAGKGTWRSPAK
ncbi:MAG TPA: hypothetical protein VIJ51_15030 [Solirubrobacteraceae bacterium]